MFVGEFDEQLCGFVVGETESFGVAEGPDPFPLDLVQPAFCLSSFLRQVWRLGGFAFEPLLGCRSQLVRFS